MHIRGTLHKSLFRLCLLSGIIIVPTSQNKTMCIKHFEYLAHNGCRRQPLLAAFQETRKAINGVPESQVGTTRPYNYSAPLALGVLTDKPAEPWHPRSHPPAHTRIRTSHAASLARENEVARLPNTCMPAGLPFHLSLGTRFLPGGYHRLQWLFTDLGIHSGLEMSQVHGYKWPHLSTSLASNFLFQFNCH